MSINKLFRKKKSKLGTAAKVLIPVAGTIAAKKLWDNKETLITEDVRSKVLEKTERLQGKIQQFHDFVQNSADESVESVFVDESENTETGEENDVTCNDTTEEIVEKTTEEDEHLSSESEEIGKEN